MNGRSLAPRWLALTLLLVTSTRALSARPSASVHLDDGSVWSLSRSANGGRVLRHGRTSPTPALPEDVASTFLQAAASVLDLRPGRFHITRSARTPLGTIVEFRETHDGKPVFGSTVRVLVDGSGAVRHVTSRALGSQLEPPTDATSAENIDALALREAHRISASARVRDRSTGFDARTGASAIQIYLDDPWGAVALVTVRAADGALLDRRWLRQDVDIEGGVFNPSPINTLADPTLRDGSNSCAAVDIAAYYTGVVAADAPVGGLYRLAGRHAVVVDEAAPTFPVAAETAFDAFYYCRDDSAFEEFNAYFWITNDAEYVEGLGFTLLNSPIEVDCHFDSPRGPFCSGTPYDYVRPGEASTGIAFTDTWDPFYVDASEDADVILHEHSHSNFHGLRPVTFCSGGETGAINEGSADYWAAGTFWQTSIDNGFDPHCLAEWFSSGFRACLRRTDSAKIYPRDVVGLVHNDGEIWSAFLVALALRIGSFETVDTLLLAAVELAPDAPTFRDMYDSLLDADSFIYGGSYAVDIAAEATPRGLTIQRAPEVSSDTSGVPLRVRKATAGGVTILWEDLGAGADGYNVYEGPLVSPPRGEDLVQAFPAPACGVLGSAGPPGYRQFTGTPEPGNVFFLVTGYVDGTEGPSGYYTTGNGRCVEHDQVANTCDP